MKKALIFFMLILLPFAIFANGAKEAAATTIETSTRIVTDDLGRSVEIPNVINRVSPTGQLSQLIIYSAYPEKMVGWSQKLSANAMKYFDPAISSLPFFGTFYGVKANLNKEALMIADPELIIDIGEIKGSTDDMIKDLDTLQEQLGIPVVFIENYLKNSDKTYEKLGEIMGESDKVQDHIKFAKEALNSVKNVEDKVTVYYSSADTGLTAVPTGNFHGEVIEFVNAENIVPSTFSTGANVVSMEQLYIWNPEYIILTSPVAYETVTTDGLWANLDAVQNGKVVFVPIEPYPLIDSPAATNRLLGIYYLEWLFYNDVYNVDMVEKMIEYYDTFYHYDLSVEKAKSLLSL